MQAAKDEFNQFKQTSGRELSMGGYGGGISEFERNMNFRMETLARRENQVINRINSSNATINTIMQLTDKKYEMAKDEYDTEYNKNLKAIEIYNSELDDQQKDALTAFTTMGNLLSESGLSELTPELSTQMDTLALKAGLQPGVFQTALKGLAAKEKMDNMKVVGNNVYMWTTDAEGNPHLKLIQSVSDGKPEDTEKGTESERKSQAFGIVNQILALPTEQGYKDKNGYLTAQGFKDLVSAAREDNISRKEFLEEYSYLLYPKGASAYGLSVKEKEDYGIE
jgi:chaperonin cofactor prefoldin